MENYVNVKASIAFYTQDRILRNLDSCLPVKGEKSDIQYMQTKQLIIKRDGEAWKIYEDQRGLIKHIADVVEPTIAGNGNMVIFKGVKKMLAGQEVECRYIILPAKMRADLDKQTAAIADALRLAEFARLKQLIEEVSYVNA